MFRLGYILGMVHRMEKDRLQFRLERISSIIYVVSISVFLCIQAWILFMIMIHENLMTGMICLLACSQRSIGLNSIAFLSPFGCLLPIQLTGIGLVSWRDPLLDSHRMDNLISIYRVLVIEFKSGWADLVPVTPLPWASIYWKRTVKRGLFWWVQ